MTNLRLRLLSYFVIAYMMLAFAWWSILLFKKNDDAFQAKVELQAMGMAAEGLIENRNDFFKTASYDELVDKYERQEYMIFGEASVFVLSLIVGIWLINRSYSKEVKAADQQRNFLLSITHELKSPIASIRLILQTFLKHDLNPSQSEQLNNNALAETERLNNLVNNLLMAAKVEDSYQPMLESIDLKELFSDLVSEMKSKYPNAKILLEMGNLTPIMADKLGIRSVALNLIENAIKYSDGPAEIDIKIQEQKNNILLEFKDQGIGITDQEKKKIFNKFYRVGNEDTRKTKGTGLGLYIVKQIIDNHKGEISVYNNKPRGTIFSIKLPSSTN